MKTPEREGYLALQLGCGSKREKQLNGRCAQGLSLLDTPVSLPWKPDLLIDMSCLLQNVVSWRVKS